jgi:hypothetical protein
MTNIRELVQRNELCQHGLCTHVNAPKVICMHADKRSSAGGQSGSRFTGTTACKKTQMLTVRLMR